MTAQDASTPARGRGSGMRRRGFLTSLGAGGLATAATLFGRATPAAAVAAGCCDLCYPPTGSISACQTGSYYVWSCTLTTYLWCLCCEHGAHIPGSRCGGYSYTAYSCQY